MDKTADSPEQQERSARIIHDEAERMARMVEQLLDLAQIESGQLILAREAIDMGRLAEEIRRSFDLRAQDKGIRLALDVQPTPAIVGDHDRLVQVFSNLVDNALDHTPHGGQIHMSVYPHGQEAVEVTVQDTGSGIPPQEINRVFERFYQLDKSRVRAKRGRGAGLGLAIVKELVEAHGGRIIARSQVDQGTSFTVRLPVVPPVEPTLARRR
jgi:two-component system sensor histidine kinase ResE